MKTLNLKINLVDYNKNKTFVTQSGESITYSNLVTSDGVKIKCTPEVIDDILNNDGKNVSFGDKGKLVINGLVNGKF